MTTKSPPSMKRRFTGKKGKEQLISALCMQPCTAGKLDIAQKLSDAGKLFDFAPGKTIINEGDADNDIFYILSGEVSVSVHERVVATRTANQHVGEMALIDSTSRRSSTIEAIERTLVLRVSESDMTSIANTHPEVWRRMAGEVAARLKERGKFITQPNEVPLVFIGSSSEALTEASWVQSSLNRRTTVSQLWTQGVFQLSQTTIESLVKKSTECDFAALLLTPDDMTGSRGKKTSSPRDNVVFELGLFMGALGRERTFIITPKGSDLKLPTDLLGITILPYDTSKATTGAQLGPVTKAIWKRIQELGPK